MVQCKLCNKEFKNYRCLWSHLYKAHDRSFSENGGKKYYDMFISTTLSHKCKNPNCQNETKFIGLTGGYANTCCHECSNIYNGFIRKGRFLGRPSPMKGKKASLETRLKQSKSIKAFYKTDKGIQHANKTSIRQMGKNNSCHKMSKETKNELRKKISIKMKQKILSGKFTPPITNSWANSKTKIKINGFVYTYRSTWEAVFQILNPNCEYEKLRIDYIGIDNTHHSYIIDFIDTQNRIIYEIKPDVLITDQKNILKIQAAIQWAEKNNYIFKIISNEYFKENAKKINYDLYDKKLKKGMKQFL